jgi:RNA polymerase sigma-70 factor (ECF subfamily)
MRDQPFLPWLNAIARHKLIDAMRRRGRRSETPIENFTQVLPDETPPPETSPGELARLVARLEGRQGEIVAAISLEGAGIKDVAARFGMSEGAVRVSLHRGLKKLASLLHETEA